MAVVHFVMNVRELNGLARVADLHALPKAAREIRKAVDRPGHGVQLTAAEFTTLYASKSLWPSHRKVLDPAAERLRAAEAYEVERDARVKPQLEARRAELQALAS